MALLAMQSMLAGCGVHADYKEWLCSLAMLSMQTMLAGYDYSGYAGWFCYLHVLANSLAMIFGFAGFYAG